MRKFNIIIIVIIVIIIIIIIIIIICALEQLLPHAADSLDGSQVDLRESEREREGVREGE